MYKQIGFSFDDAKGYAKRLHDLVEQAVYFYRANGLDDHYSPPAGKRLDYRIRPSPKLEKNLNLSIWLLFENRFRKCMIKDLSPSGAGIILPFRDPHNIFVKGRPFTALVEFGNGERFITKSFVHYDREIFPNLKWKDHLRELNFMIHDEDLPFFTSAGRAPVRNKDPEKWTIEMEDEKLKRLVEIIGK